MRSRSGAAALGTLCVALAAIAVLGTLAAGWTFAQALEAFVVSNVVIGTSFGLCGGLIAWHRPRLPLGWMYALGGIAQTATAAAAPVAHLLHEAAAPTALVRLALTVFAWSWPLNIGVVLPLSLLLLPDGRLPSPRWRPAFVVVAATSPLFVVEIGAAPVDLAGFPDAFGTLPGYDDLTALWLASEVRWSLSMLVGVAALVVRYRRGTEALRRQLLWLLSAALVVLAAVVPFALVAGTPLVVLFSIPLLPAAIAVGVLRHQLLDIRLVVARGATYALLSALVLAAYAALVVVLSGVASALLVALLVLPVRARLQSVVDRLMYGQRADPVRVASRVGGRLGTGLVDALEAVRTELRLPYVAVVLAGTEVAAAGAPGAHTASVPLSDGSLVVGLRTGEQRLAQADRTVLAMLAGPLSAAVDATRLSQQLQESRELLVLAREEERRRLRRDLHDGLGPLLTGVALSADAAANLAEQEPEQSRALLATVRRESRTAIAEVRRIVDDLRPPALDELGLVAALEARAAQVSHRQDGTVLQATVDAPPELPPLPAALEVAAYRIATEALTNAIRHSRARKVVVRLACDDQLRVEVHDDGADDGGGWAAGVGLTSIRERATELGGWCDAGPGPSGGVVRVALPLGSA